MLVKVKTKTLSIIKLYGLTVKTKYFEYAKFFVERVGIP